MEIKTPFDHPQTDAGIVRGFGSVVERRLPLWRARLAAAPEELASLEQETMDFSREVSQRLLAAILVAASVQAAVEARAEQARRRVPGFPPSSGVYFSAIHRQGSYSIQTTRTEAGLAAAGMARYHRALRNQT